MTDATIGATTGATTVTWTPFFWESNSAWGTVATRADWYVMVDRMAKQVGCTRVAAYNLMLKGRKADWTHPNTLVELVLEGKTTVIANFGFRREHTGMTLLAWANEQGMDLSLG